MQIKKLKFVGGPKDGLEKDCQGVVPDIVTTDTYHVLGSSAYILSEVNWETGEVTYEHYAVEKYEMDNK